MVQSVGGFSSLPPGLKAKFEGLAKLNDGKIDGQEQQILQELQSAFQNIADPNIRKLIQGVAEQMNMSGAQAAARMASGGEVDGAGGNFRAQNAGSAADPMSNNRCSGGNCGSGDDGNVARAAGDNGSATPALGGKGGMMFEDMVAQFLFDVIKEMQEELKKKMAEYKAMSKSGKGGGGGDKAGGAGGGDSDSRQLLFEEIKNMMQKMQQMIQSLSNILNTMHNGAMNAIRKIQ